MVGLLSTSAWAQSSDDPLVPSPGSGVVENIRFHEASMMLAHAGWVLGALGLMFTAYALSLGKDPRTLAWRAGDGIFRGVVVTLVAIAIIYVAPVMSGRPAGLMLVTPGERVVVFLLAGLTLSGFFGWQQRQERLKQEKRARRRTKARKNRTVERDEFTESLKGRN